MPISTDQFSKIQGDVWSKGFPKYNETYYFFSIATGKGKPEAFSECLKSLAKTGLISDLAKARADQGQVAGSNDKVPMSNALIAFTFTGLQVIDAVLTNKLGLDTIKKTDKAFSVGMKNRGVLSDPPDTKWDSLFRSTPIHGVLKVAGSDATQVEETLKKILKELKHGDVTLAVDGTSAPTAAKSRMDGETLKERGKEHFGFEDGISQPLIAGLDNAQLKLQADGGIMKTDSEIIIISDDSVSAEPATKRPAWMNNGTFLVIRKLEQNVAAFDKLTNDFAKYGLTSQEQMGAKLMGRWRSGAPVAQDDDTDKNKAKTFNEFTYTDRISCPLAAHTRKTNPRISNAKKQETNSGGARFAFIIRHGIPYGSEFSGKSDDNGQRGLLFACYQSSIEKGFEFIQSAWANNPEFPPRLKGEKDAGLDPIIGQAPDGGKLSTAFIDTKNKRQDLPFDTYGKLVNLKGGEYFFVPSISALANGLEPDTVKNKPVRKQVNLSRL